MPSKHLLRELARTLDTEIRSRPQLWQQWDKSECFASLVKLFGPRQIDVRTEPYRRGAGLSLRGFFCRTEVGDKPKFVIFLNTAHHPGAVAATFGHELGHYLYGSMVGETTSMTAFMEGTFSAHLLEEHELFADSLVALGAYTREQIKQIGPVSRMEPGSSDRFFRRIQKARESTATRFKLHLGESKVTAPWRVCYLTSMIHFFKLRCALAETIDI